MYYILINTICLLLFCTPICRLLLLPHPLSLHLGLRPLPAPTSKQRGFFFSYFIWGAFSGSVHLCHDLFMHYTSFLNNLSSHLSIFPPLPPSVSASPFFCLALSASPLRYLSTWATSFPPPSLPPHSYLTLYIPSSLLFLSSLSIFLPSYLPLCALYPPSLSVLLPGN